MSKIQCGGLIVKRGVSLIEVLGFEWAPGEACGILCEFGAAGIPLSYISISNTNDEKRSIIFCLDYKYLDKAKKMMVDIEKKMKPQKVTIEKKAVVCTLYGPHFLEKTGLASEVYASFCQSAIGTWSVCSSVNSVSFLISEKDLETSRKCLRTRFEWPE
jgi:aspartokinase